MFFVVVFIVLWVIDLMELVFGKKFVSVFELNVVNGNVKGEEEVDVMIEFWLFI